MGFKRPYSPFREVPSVKSRQRELKIDPLLSHVLLEDGGCLIIEVLELGAEFDDL